MEQQIYSNQNNTRFKKVEDIVRKWLLIDDPYVIRVIVASVIANLIEGDPFWLFIVAASGGTKTELLRCLNMLEFIYPLSDLTPQTFLSGEKKNKNASLLLRLPKNKPTIIVLKDFTTVLTMHQDKKLAILSQLREIFDGYFIKSFGTGVTIEWQGKIGLIAGVTSVIDTHYSVYQNLGERFLQYRPKQADGIELAKRAMNNAGYEKQMREELQTAFKELFTKLTIYNDITINSELINKISHLAAFCSRARSNILRDSNNRDVISIPDPELPTRIAKQLIQLLKGLNILSDGYIDENMKIITKICLDSISKNRKMVLKSLLGKDTKTLKQVAAIVQYPENTTRRILEDLQCLDLVTKEELSDRNVVYKLSDYAMNLISHFVF